MTRSEMDHAKITRIANVDEMANNRKVRWIQISETKRTRNADPKIYISLPNESSGRYQHVCETIFIGTTERGRQRKSRMTREEGESAPPQNISVIYDGLLAARTWRFPFFRLLQSQIV